MFQNTIESQVKHKIYQDYYFAEQYYTQRALAKKYSIGESTVNRILKEYDIPRKVRKQKNQATYKHIGKMAKTRLLLKKEETGWNAMRKKLLLKVAGK